MVLIDTSAWIGYFNDFSPVADMVENVIRNGKAVLCPNRMDGNFARRSR